MSPPSPPRVRAITLPLLPTQEILFLEIRCGKGVPFLIDTPSSPAPQSAAKRPRASRFKEHIDDPAVPPYKAPEESISSPLEVATTTPPKRRGLRRFFHHVRHFQSLTPAPSSLYSRPVVRQPKVPTTPRPVTPLLSRAPFDIPTVAITAPSSPTRSLSTSTSAAETAKTVAWARTQQSTSSLTLPDPQLLSIPSGSRYRSPRRSNNPKKKPSHEESVLNITDFLSNAAKGGAYPILARPSDRALGTALGLGI